MESELLTRVYQNLINIVFQSLSAKRVFFTRILLEAISFIREFTQTIEIECKIKDAVFKRTSKID